MLTPRSQLLGVSLLACLIAGCERSASPEPPKPPADAPSVLLITLDTTRADRLGCYGYAAAQTPALDAIARGGVRFEHAFCQVPLTLPSHASLLTGTYPPSNGIRINGTAVLGAEVPTLVEAFKTRGYRTGAFVSAWVLGAAFGLNRGFDRYDDELGATGGGGDSLYQERTADKTCDAALRWLDEQPQTPFFAWIHFFDPHHPYAPPSPFREKLTSPYDGEIAFMDSQVDRLLKWLDSKGLRSRTLVVVAGDHGEAFDEHGEVEHGLLVYNTTMHVPLLLSCPGKLPESKEVAACVRLIDVVPTVLDFLGWEQFQDLSGESLLAAIHAPDFQPQPAYGESQYPLVGFGWSPLYCYITQDWKYIEAPRPELYDRRTDPAETRNVVAEHADVASQLASDLRQMRAEMPLREAGLASLDDKALRALEALGYVGAAQPSKVENDATPRRNPMEMIQVFRGFQDARQLSRQNRHAEVVQILEPLVTQSPESDEVHGALAEAYLSLGRFQDAERAYRDSLRTVSTNPRKLCRLGDALLSQGKTAEATECYQKALAASSNYPEAHNRMGAILLQQKQFAQAEQHFRRYLELEPASANAMTNLANVLPQLGRPDEAVQLARNALQQDPSFAPAHRFLWQVLVKTGRRLEAVDALRAACRAIPNDWTLKRQFAGLAAATPQGGPTVLQEAVVVARQCCEADPNLPENFDVLSITLAASGDLANAMQVGQQAFTLARNQGKEQLAVQIARRLQAYQSGRPN